MTSQLSMSTYYGLVKLLTTCASGSDSVAETLLQAGLSTSLHNLLVTSSFFSSSTKARASLLQSSDQLYEVRHVVLWLWTSRSGPTSSCMFQTSQEPTSVDFTLGLVVIRW